MIYYDPKYFTIEEFVPPDIYAKFKNNSVWFVNPFLLRTLDMIRSYFDKPITINNWHNGGSLEYRGFRPANCTVGAYLSQHRLGNACDFDIKDISSSEFRYHLNTYKDEMAFHYITACELNVNWNHIDLRMWDKKNNGILFFNP